MNNFLGGKIFLGEVRNFLGGGVVKNALMPIDMAFEVLNGSISLNKSYSMKFKKNRETFWNNHVESCTYHSCCYTYATITMVV